MSPLTLLFLIPKRYRLAFFDHILIPLVQPFSWLISVLDKALFSRHRARSSLAKEKRLELEIQTEFSFLFETRAAAVVPNIGVPFPEPFDFATVTVATGDLLLRIVSGLDNLTISLARAVEPNVWYDLRRVLAAVEGSVYPRQPTSYSMSEWGVLIRDNLDRLNTDFGTLHVQVQRRLMGGTSGNFRELPGTSGTESYGTKWLFDAPRVLDPRNLPLVLWSAARRRSTSLLLATRSTDFGIRKIRWLGSSTSVIPRSQPATHFVP